jgi:uracil phosphoribosyltransferase
MTVQVSHHPLIRHKLGLLRDAKTNPKLFRELVAEITQLLFYEASSDLQTSEVTVKTPLSDCRCELIWERIGVIPILRAGLGMADAIIQMLPKVTIWHLGLYRDHTTHEPITYYNKLPEQPAIDVGFVVDPMLATGGSIVAVLDILKKWGLQKIKFLALIAAPEGVERLQKAHPDVPIYLAALDSHLNENKYIVPGLGDAGDRQFGTY